VAISLIGGGNHRPVADELYHHLICILLECGRSVKSCQYQWQTGSKISTGKTCKRA